MLTIFRCLETLKEHIIKESNKEVQCEIENTFKLYNKPYVSPVASRYILHFNDSTNVNSEEEPQTKRQKTVDLTSEISKENSSESKMTCLQDK